MKRKSISIILMIAISAAMLSGCESHDTVAHGGSYSSTDGYDGGSDSGTDSGTAEYDDGSDSGTDEYAAGYDEEDGSIDETDEMGVEYSIDDISNYNGVFRYNTQSGTVYQLTDDLDSFSNITVDGINLDNGYMMSGDEEAPTAIQRSSGEKLILAGEEGGNRAPSEQDEIKIYSMDLLGYTNIGMLDQYAYTDYEEVSGDGVRACDYIPAHRGQDQLVLSDSFGTFCNVSYYSGTEYVTDQVCLFNPCYLVYDYSSYNKVPVEKTHDGYFEIDLSNLSEGSYILDSYSGFYAFSIQ